MSSKYLVGLVDDSGGFWLGFWFLMMIRTGQQCSKQPMFRNWAFYVEFKGAKNPHVLVVLGWSLDDSGGSWLGVLFLILMETGQQCTKQLMFQNSAFHIEFKGVVEDSDWGFESWSWTGNLKFHKKMSLIPKYPKAHILGLTIFKIKKFWSIFMILPFVDVTLGTVFKGKIFWRSCRCQKATIYIYKVAVSVCLSVTFYVTWSICS